MSRIYLVSFVAIAGLAVLGVDYANQARLTGKGLSGLGFEGYKATVIARYDADQAARAAAKEREALLDLDRRELLPAAPEGWVRRDYTDADRAVFEGEPDPLEGLTPGSAGAMTAFVAGNEQVKRSRDAREVFVYETDGALIALRLAYNDPDRKPLGMSGVAMDIVQGNITAMSVDQPFALVRGVAFREELGVFGLDAEEREHRVISARIGRELTVSLSAIASDEQIVALLESIDYDRLNRMLPEPVPGIGSEAPEVDPLAGAELAAQIVAAERAAVIARGAAQEARLRGVGDTMADENASGLERVTSLFGMMFGSGEKEAREAERVAAEEIRINRSASGSTFGNCTTEGGVRRCRVGD